MTVLLWCNERLMVRSRRLPGRVQWTSRRWIRCHQPALNVTLQHRYKNVCTCAYTYMHICIYTCILYIDAFCHELKVFIKYLLKKTTHSLPCCPFLSLLKPVSSPPLPISSQWASCFECWENTVVILFSVCFCLFFTLHKGRDTSLAPPIAL